MQTYIALLRGINVSGHNKIKMVDLRFLLNKEGFQNVSTYIQSGNVIFNSKIESISTIEKLIKNKISDQFKYNVNVLVLKKEELLQTFKSNPFLNRKEIDISKLYTTFLQEKPKEEGINELIKITQIVNEEIEIIDKNIYLHFPEGAARAKLNNNFIEKKLKTVATTRNWKTITKLVELSNIE